MSASARDFVEAFGLDTDLYSKMVRDLQRGESAYYNDDLDDLCQEFAQQLRPIVRKELEHDGSVGRTELSLIKDFNTVALTTKTETADKAIARIKKNVSTLNDITLNKVFRVEVGKQSDVITKLREVTTELGGTDIDIDPKIRSQFKGTDTLKEYNRLRRELNAVPKDFIMQKVRESGKPYLPVREIRESLGENGIRHHTVPDGFVGFIDDQMKYYTVEGKLLNGTPVGDVRMNPDYDPVKDNAYVCDARAPLAKGYQRIYTLDYKASTTQDKFKKVAEFDKKADALRKKWLREFKASGVQKREGVLAMIAELVYQTSGRIGSKSGQTDGARTYGITTLLVGHYKQRGSNRLIEYPGKKAQIQKHKLSSANPNQRLLIEALDELASGKARKEPLITFRGRGITGNALNKYLASLGMPKGVTVHKFRTLKGTRIAKRILESSPLLERKRGLNATQVNKWLKSALEKVAKELGHFSNGKITVATAIANYIDPSVLVDFYEKLGMRMPANIEKVANLVSKER
jgi:DNA topoisomerase IB